MTAVEYLYERLERMIPRTALYGIDKREYFEKAKEMEKQQIKETFSNGADWELYGFQLSSEDRAELYYNQKFKNKEL